MSLNAVTERPLDGLIFTYSQDEKFNVEAIVVRFITPLDEIKSQRYTTAVSLVSEACRKYPDKAQLAKKLSALYGASLHSFSYRCGNSLVSGITVNSIGDGYTLDGEKITEDCAELLLDCIFDPDIVDGAFSEPYFSQKKRERIEKIKSTFNDRHSYAVLRAAEIAFEGEPASVSPSGTVENAEKITAQNLAQSYRELLDTALISITFCGGGTNKRAQELVKSRFIRHVKERGGAAAYSENLNADSKIKSEPKYVTEQIDQSQSKLVMYFKTQSPDIYANRLAVAMYGGTPFSKLFINVREKMSLCYYCQSGMIECKNTMIVDSGVEHGNEQKAQTEILRQLEAMKNGDFTDEDIENTKRYLIGAVRADYDSAEDLNSWYFQQFARGTSDSPLEAIEKIRSISRDDVTQAARGFALDAVYVLEPSAQGGVENA